MRQNDFAQELNKLCFDEQIIEKVLVRSLDDDIRNLKQEHQMELEVKSEYQDEKENVQPTYMRLRPQRTKKFQRVDVQYSKDPCSCSKSGCMKMYCDCLARGKMCSLLCSCVGCKNSTPNERLLTQVKCIQNGEHDALLAPRDRFRSLRFKDGCTCKKSQCLKKYCECYASGRACGRGCLCFDCLNSEDELSQSSDSMPMKKCLSTTIRLRQEPLPQVSVKPFSMRRRTYSFELGGLSETYWNTVNCRLLSHFCQNRMN